jgi:hypothetical protein
MIGDRDLEWLINESHRYRLTCGWFLVIRAEWCDETPGKLHGLSYGLILQDAHEHRILGFDNSHAFDGANPGEPFDHEHKPGKVGQRFRYDFISAGQLFEDFWTRVELFCASKGVAFEIEE